MIGSDGSALAPLRPLGAGKPHRAYGTLPRVLASTRASSGCCPLPQAIHKMTGDAGAPINMRNRGVIREGAKADLVVFDARRIADAATYQDPHRYPAGMEHVLVNGRFVIKHGEHTGSLPGRVLTPP